MEMAILLCMMANLYNATPLSATVGLCGDSCMEMFQWADASPGRSFIWEQRYFLSFFKIRDGIEYRKRQKQCSYLESVTVDWALSPADFILPDGSPGSMKTICFTSRGLLPWLFSMHRNAIRGHSADMVPCVEHSVQAYYATAAAGCRSLDAWPSFDVFNITFTPGADFRVDLRPLLDHYTALPGEWSNLKGDAETCGLSVFPTDAIVEVGSFLSFLTARIHYSSGTLPASHWLVQL